ncbi:hypothetical protein SAY87_003740 [Trapa incisa]|uniref:Transcription factor TFIIIB component B'' Myb domain-containing protein n=1 Tax=Trapa incisa TaxID=236973 RepID=A0AAN7KPI5_9MYRT|nr:hypothetical protein SAY87_003740 [Trapa incisa]
MMDPFEDIFAESVQKPGPSHNKFQPRARPGSKPGSKPSTVPNKEKQQEQHSLESTASVDDGLNVATNFSSDLCGIYKPKDLVISVENRQIRDPGFEIEIVGGDTSKEDTDVVTAPGSNLGESHIYVNMTAEIDPIGFNCENLHELLHVPSESGGRLCKKFHPQPKGTQSSGIDMLDSSVSLPCELNKVPHDNDDWHSSHVKSSEENEDVVSHLESFDGLLTTSHNKEGNGLLSSDLSNVDGKDPLSYFESEYMDVPGSITQILEYPSIVLEEPNNEDLVSQPPDDTTFDDHLETSTLNTSILRDADYPDLENISQMTNKSSIYNVDNEEGEKSSRQLKKRVAAHLPGFDGDAQDDEGFHLNHNGIANEENENDESNDWNTLEKEKAMRNSKANSCQSGKPSRKRKAAVGATDKFKEEPKKKFSHSTQRSRRCLDKRLLQTPEEEIDYQKLKIKDLILFAEHKERLAKKNARLSRSLSTGQSCENVSDGDHAHNREGSTLPEGEPSTNTESTVVATFNYQSYMKKTPIVRWQKQDTELFYEGVRQFGTDLSLIKELFPKLTRRQIKHKLKKEERQNPMMLFEALTSRTKGHGHFQLVLERLKAAVQEKEESKLSNSEEILGEDDFEDSNLETMQDVREAAKTGENNGGNGDTEGNNEGNNDEHERSLKLNENKENDEDVDDGDFFSSYKSEF